MRSKKECEEANALLKEYGRYRERTGSSLLEAVENNLLGVEACLEWILELPIPEYDRPVEKTLRDIKAIFNQREDIWHLPQR